jgi:two-component sensor histidine kinase
MKEIFAFLFTFVSSFLVLAQNQSLIDSLIAESKTATLDSVRAKYHYELCYQWADYNFDSAIYHARVVQMIAERSENQRIAFDGLMAIGLAYDFNYQIDSAIHYYSKGASLAESLNYLKGEAVAKFNIGVAHYYAGQMEKAIEFYLETEKTYQELKDEKNLARLYNNLGVIYRQTKKFDLALDTYLRAISIKRKLNDITGVMNTLTNLSTVYQKLEKYPEAIQASEEVVSLAKKQHNNGALLYEYINLARIYESMKQEDLTFIYFRKAEALIDNNQNYPFITEIYHYLSKFYVKNKNHPEARKYLKLVDKRISDDKVDMLMNHFLTKAKYYEQIEDYRQSTIALDSAFILQGKLYDNEVLEITTEMEQLYEKEKSDLEIKRLNTENELQSLTIEKSTRERNGIILFATLILGVAILLYTLYRQNQKSLNERETLLKEIHHRVKNNLQVISSLLNIQAAYLKDEAAIDAVKEGQNRVKSMALIHEKLYQNDNLSGVSVDDYIQNLVKSLFHSFGISSEEIQSHLEVDKIKLDIDTLIPLGLILNELISNSLKYAFPDRKGQIQVILHKNKDKLDLLLKDNGQGFDPDQIDSSNSYGWRMVKSLSKKLKAEIEMRNNQGTEIAMSIRNFKLA